jgi:hypothetical protein
VVEKITKSIVWQLNLKIGRLVGNMKESKNIVERIFKNDECTSIWKYDLDKSNVNPISVEHKWNPSYLKEIEIRQKRGR